MSQALKIAELAGEQWGLVTAAQASSIGVSNQVLSRWTRESMLLRVAHGVYKIVGSPHDSRDELRAAWLGLDPARTATDRVAERPIDSVVSHRSAAVLHGLGDLDADVHEFTVAGRRQSRRAEVRIHTRRDGIPDDEWTVASGLPVTTVLTTIRDLAEAHIDGGHLASVVRDAVAAALIDIDELSTVLAPHAHKYGVPLGDGAGLIQRFLAEAGLPQTTTRAAELARSQASLADAVRSLTTSDPALLPKIQEILRLADTPERRRLIETISSPEMQRQIRDVSHNLRMFRDGHP